MGRLKLPTMKAGVTVDPKTALAPAGEIAFDADAQRLRLFDGLSGTPGGVDIGAPALITQVGAGALPSRLADKAQLVGISPRDFGGVGNAANDTTDDSAAVQRAIDACQSLVPPAPLRIDGFFRAKNLKFNRPVDSTLNIFDVRGVGRGAGFLIDGPGTLVDTDIAWDSVTPVSGEIFFGNLNIVSPNNTDLCLTMSPKFINVWFDEIMWVRPKFMAGPTYAQGITITNSRAMSWRGDFFDTRGAYDCHIDRLRTKFGGVPIDGAPLGHVVNWTRGSTQQPVYRNSITNGAFEGCGKIAKIDNVVEFAFVGNYCEFNNGMALDFSGGGNTAVTVAQNTFTATNAQVADPTFYEIAWGSTLRAESRSNYCNSRLHDTNGMTGANLLDTKMDVVLGELFRGFRNDPLLEAANPVGNVTLRDTPYGEMSFRGGQWQSTLSGLQLPSGLIVPGMARSSTVAIGGRKLPIRRVQGPTNPQSDSTPYGGGTVGWGAGSYAENTNLAAGQPRGWRCTAGGVPGTWVADAAYP